MPPGLPSGWQVLHHRRSLPLCPSTLCHRARGHTLPAHARRNGPAQPADPKGGLRTQEFPAPESTTQKGVPQTAHLLGGRRPLRLPTHRGHLPTVRLGICSDPQGRPPAHHLGRNHQTAPLPPDQPSSSSARTRRQGGKAGRQDFRWVENVMLGEPQTNVILSGEITAEAATLYAYITNFSKLSPERVAIVVNRAGRERHLIEDTFNTQKNNGIGLEHVFCANTTASKNYYTMMQVAQILWILTCRGCLQRLYDWARRATEQGLARAVWEGLRAARLPPDLPPWAKSVSASPS